MKVKEMCRQVNEMVKEDGRFKRLKIITNDCTYDRENTTMTLTPLKEPIVKFESRYNIFCLTPSGLFTYVKERDELLQINTGDHPFKEFQKRGLDYIIVSGNGEHAAFTLIKGKMKEVSSKNGNNNSRY